MTGIKRGIQEASASSKPGPPQAQAQAEARGVADFDEADPAARIDVPRWSPEPLQVALWRRVFYTKFAEMVGTLDSNAARGEMKQLADQFIELSAAHDEWLGAKHQYTVLHAVPFMQPRAAAPVARYVIQRYYRDEAARVLKPIRAFFRKRC